MNQEMLQQAHREIIAANWRAASLLDDLANGESHGGEAYENALEMLSHIHKALTLMFEGNVGLPDK